MAPRREGETRRQFNERFGHESPDIEPVHGGEFLVNAFWELSRFRSAGLGGPEPIRPADIVGWCHLTNFELRPDETKIILRMDAAFREAWHVEAEQMKPKAPSKPGQ